MQRLLSPSRRLSVFRSLATLRRTAARTAARTARPTALRTRRPTALRTRRRTAARTALRTRLQTAARTVRRTVRVKLLAARSRERGRDFRPLFAFAYRQLSTADPVLGPTASSNSSAADRRCSAYPPNGKTRDRLVSRYQHRCHADNLSARATSRRGQIGGTNLPQLGSA